MHSSFSIVELLIGIVVLAILSAFAIPKFGSSMQFSHTVERKTQLLLIRATIQENRNAQLMHKSTVKYDKNLDKVLDGLHIADIWHKQSDSTYEVAVANDIVKFKYSQTDGSFICQHIAQSGCDELNQ